MLLFIRVVVLVVMVVVIVIVAATVVSQGSRTWVSAVEFLRISWYVLVVAFVI